MNQIDQDIIPPVDRALLEAELNASTLMRYTNKGGNEIYSVDHRTGPNTVREIGRLRELAFRSAGGGTGKEIDLDEFDLSERPYHQLLVWNPEDKEIIGGYRYILCKNAITDNAIELSTTELLTFSDTFIKDYLPYTIELGRSFVQPRYRPGPNNRAGLFSLDNLWDGLGALLVLHPDMKYFFGKVTMYPHFNREARDLILSFMQHFFPGRYDLAKPMQELKIKHDTRPFIESIKELSYKDAHRILNGKVRELNENIPPLVNAYMNLSATMVTFGTAINPHFGNVEETGILITIDDVYSSKRERHVKTFLSELGRTI